jgi:hypothetical protein
VPVSKRFYHYCIVNCNVTLVNKIFFPRRVLAAGSICCISIHDLMASI